MSKTVLFLVLVLFLAGCGARRPTDSTPALAHKVVNSAYSQIGKKYRLGGVSPQTGFDCSGLVWWAYQENGMTVPRRTVEQAKIGFAVPRQNAHPGDILVFRTPRSANGLHTGLYAGGDTFIHSPSSGARVRVENMNTSVWSSKLIAVRRVVH
jgi:cell wall-associated NlpC family hydrolase